MLLMKVSIRSNVVGTMVIPLMAIISSANSFSLKKLLLIDSLSTTVIKEFSSIKTMSSLRTILSSSASREIFLGALTHKSLYYHKQTMEDLPRLHSRAIRWTNKE